MHHCHATDCAAKVPPEMFMCRKHWFSLPRAMRDEIWRTYRPGQCDDWQISRAYSEAAKAAVRFVAAKEGREADVSIYEMLEPSSGEPHER